MTENEVCDTMATIFLSIACPILSAVIVWLEDLTTSTSNTSFCISVSNCWTLQGAADWEWADASRFRFIFLEYVCNTYPICYNIACDLFTHHDFVVYNTNNTVCFYTIIIYFIQIWSILCWKMTTQPPSASPPPPPQKTTKKTLAFFHPTHKKRKKNKKKKRKNTKKQTRGQKKRKRKSKMEI